MDTYRLDQDQFNKRMSEDQIFGIAYENFSIDLKIKKFYQDHIH